MQLAADALRIVKHRRARGAALRHALVPCRDEPVGVARREVALGDSVAAEDAHLQPTGQHSQLWRRGGSAAEAEAAVAHAGIEHT